MVTVKMYGDLVADDDARILRWWGYSGLCCAEDVERGLLMAEGDDVELLINSPGGSMTAGTQIYSLLHRYAGKVTATVQGLAASAATAAMMGASRIRAEPGALICVHNPSGSTEGDYHEHRHTAETLENARDALTALYMPRCKKTREELENLMSRDVLLDAQTALAWGFVDEVMEGVEPDVKDVLVASAAGYPRVTQKMRDAFDAACASQKRKTGAAVIRALAEF